MKKVKPKSEFVSEKVEFQQVSEKQVQNSITVTNSHLVKESAFQ